MINATVLMADLEAMNRLYPLDLNDTPHEKKKNPQKSRIVATGDCRCSHPVQYRRPILQKEGPLDTEKATHPQDLGQWP